MGVVFDGRVGAVFWARIVGIFWARVRLWGGKGSQRTLWPISDDPNNDRAGLGGGRACGALNKRFSGGESTFEYDSIRSI